MGRRPRIRIVVLVAAALLLVPAGPVAAGGGPPSNDDFSEARPIAVADFPFTDQVDAIDSTVEPGEPGDGCDGTGTGTIWYRITPTRTILLQADTFGTPPPAQATLSIFRGTQPTDLNEIACNFDANRTENDARVTFKALAGVRYYIRVGRANGVVHIRVRRVTPPANDDFANGTLVESLPFDDLTHTGKATIQNREPNPVGFHDIADHGPTLWYRVRLPKTRLVKIDTFETEMDAWIMVHRGTALGALTTVLGNDTTSGFEPGAAVSFLAFAGQTYHVQVGGSGENGPVRVRMRRGTPLPNDQFSQATALVSNGPIVDAGDTRDATWQAAERQEFNGVCNAAFVSNSVWYTFTPTVTDEYVLDASLTGYRTAIRIWTGDSLGTLVGHDCGRISAIFNATAGTVYRIQVAGAFGDSGPLFLTLDPTS